MKHNHLDSLKVETTYAYTLCKGIIASWQTMSKKAKYRKALLKRDNHTCVYCQCNLVEGQNHSFDHILPKSEHSYDDNRQNSEYNLVSCCIACNRLKGVKSTYDFMVDNGYTMAEIIRVQAYIGKIITGELKIK